ncbi:MAG: hypothetical protein KGI08_10170, partial [Thaumarchaeota archaeon]|nr:hypothetical protein [Nitrososphaerota archaeon]
VKHGWDAKVKDITLNVRKPQNFILDPDGYIDVYGNYVGAFLGEKIESSAKDLIEMYPNKAGYIKLKVDNKLGTPVTRTEWWTDEYCFTTFGDIVLDKHKNEFFNYAKDDEEKPLNHFSVPKMPYTFLSVFSLQEQPHDITNLIEQNIANQDRITDRDEQISKNLASANNAVALSGTSFDKETASQAMDSFYGEGFLLVPNGDVNGAVKRIPASELPSSIFKAQDNDKIALRSIFGTQGLSAIEQNEDTTARGMILNQSHDSSRIGGGIGDSLEQVADNIFNWWAQLYTVFYDEPHYGAIMGSGRAVDYVKIISNNFQRKFVISVSPNSMQPKDEITEMNLAVDLANSGWLDPINLFKKLNYPDPLETAKMVALWKTSPQTYVQQFFPESGQPQGAGAPNPPDIPQQPLPQDASLSSPPASPSLSQVPINSQSLPK